MRRLTTTAAAAIAVLALSACGGGDGGPGPTAGSDDGSSPLNTWTPTPGGDGTSATSEDGNDTATWTGTSSSPTSTTSATPTTPGTSGSSASATSSDTGTPFDAQEFTSRLRSAVDENPTVSIEVEATIGGQAGLTASGVQDLGEDALDMTVDIGGQELGYRLVDGQYYLAQPPKWVPVTEDSSNPLIQQTLEQVQLLSMRTQLDAFLAGVEKAGDKGSEEIDGVTTRHYTATVDTATVREELGTAPDPGAPESITYDVWLDEDDLIRQMTFTQEGANATMTASKWGEPVDIREPKDSELAQVPESGTS